MDKLSIDLSPSDSLLLNQTITEIRTRLQRQHIRLVTENKAPFQTIIQGNIVYKFLNQKFNKTWATPISLNTKGKQLWLNIKLDQAFINDLFEIFDNANITTSEVIGTLSKEASQPQSSEEILTLSVENFTFQEGGEKLTLLCKNDGFIRLEPKINFSMTTNNITSTGNSPIAHATNIRTDFSVPPPSLRSQNISPSPGAMVSSTPFRSAQSFPNIRPTTQQPFTVPPLTTRSKSQKQHISYVQKKVGGYHTYESMDSEKEERSVRPKKKKPEMDIYEKLRSTIKKAHPREKQDEGFRILDKVMNKMEMGMKVSDVHKIFLEEGIRGDDSSGSDLEINASNLMNSSKAGEKTPALVELETANTTCTESDQVSENRTQSEPVVSNLGNPFLTSPEKVKNTGANIQYTEIDKSNQENRIVTRSQNQQLEY